MAWEGTLNWGTPRGKSVPGDGAGGTAGGAGGEWAGGPDVPTRERESPPGLGVTPAGSISAPAARLSPPLDPARRSGWAFCGCEVARYRGQLPSTGQSEGHRPAWASEVLTE